MPAVIVAVPGATGCPDTNYRGKAEYAVRALEGRDFVYLHVEAPDEAAHAGSLEDKIRAIEAFDELVVGTVVDGLSALGDYRLLVLPDHPTPVRRMTHTAESVPFILYDSKGEFPKTGAADYSERSAAASGLHLPYGHQLLERLIRG